MRVANITMRPESDAQAAALANYLEMQEIQTVEYELFGKGNACVLAVGPHFDKHLHPDLVHALIELTN